MIFGKGNRMEELIKRLERVIATGAPDKDGLHPISAETVLEVVKQLPPIQPVNNSENPNSSDVVSREQAIDAVRATLLAWSYMPEWRDNKIIEAIKRLPPIQPKRGRWILDRSGAYCCSKCMEPCATYVMMKPRDKFCKMCGAKMEVTT